MLQPDRLPVGAPDGAARDAAAHSFRVRGSGESSPPGGYWLQGRR